MSAMNQLHNEFPELGESVVGTSESRARALLEELRGARDQQAAAHNEAVQFMASMFPGKTDAAVREALEAADWDIDAATAALADTDNTPAPRDAPETEAIMAMFYNMVDEETIRAAVERNEGDADATANELLALLEARAGDNAARQRLEDARIEAEHRKIVEYLSGRFDVLPQDSIEALMERFAWNISAATDELVVMAEDACVGKLRLRFADFDDDMLKKAVMAASWKLSEAEAILDAEVERRAQGARAAVEERIAAIKVAEEQTGSADEREREIARLEKEASEADAAAVRAVIAADHASSCMANMDVEEERLNRSMMVAGSVAKIVEGGKRNLGAAIADGLAERFGPNGTATEEITAPEPSPAVEDVDEPAPTEDMPFSLNGASTDVVQGRSAAVRAGAERYDTGATVEAHFTYAGEAVSSNSEWMGLFRVGRDSSKYSTYVYMPAGAAKGMVSMHAKKDGHYVFRLLSRSLDVLAQSAPFRVGPTYSLDIEVVDVKRIKVSTVLVAGVPSTAAWVGLYSSADADSSAYLKYDYRHSSGSQMITLPRAGKWEVRLFTNNTYHPAVTKSVATDGENALKLTRAGAVTTISVRAETVDPAQDRVWVGVFNTAEPMDSQTMRRWKHVGINTLEVTFKTPQTKGTYHARLFARGETTPIAVSEESFEVV